MKNNNALIYAVAAMFCTTVTGVCLVAVLVPGENAVTLIGIIGGILAATVASLLSLAKISGVERTVDDLANGKMDAKIRAGVADVLAEHLIRRDAKPQLDEDRQRRAEGHRTRPRQSSEAAAD